MCIHISFKPWLDIICKQFTYLNYCNTEIKFNRVIKPSLQLEFSHRSLQNRDVSLCMLQKLDSELLLYWSIFKIPPLRTPITLWAKLLREPSYLTQHSGLVFIYNGKICFQILWLRNRVLNKLNWPLRVISDSLTINKPYLIFYKWKGSRVLVHYSNFPQK